MKVTKGYVAVKEDGTFLIISVVLKWGTESVHVGETSNIELATVLEYPNHRIITGRRPANLPDKLTYIPVEVRREVVQTGWGVD
jgi:hypothetical protein